jgi:hypothetical protein
MSLEEKVLNLVEQISKVNLSQAYVSIEVEKSQELIDFLGSKNISAKIAEWNYPEGLYIGTHTVLENLNLIVLSLSW